MSVICKFSVEHSEVHRGVVYIEHVVQWLMMMDNICEQKVAMAFDGQHMLGTAIGLLQNLAIECMSLNPKIPCYRC